LGETALAASETLPLLDFQFDAIVIGAGPAGAVAALLLARAGRHTLLVDAKSFPRGKVCGGCLSARALAALDQLDLNRTIAACAGEPIAALEVLHRGRSISVQLPTGLAVTRSTLDSALVAAAESAGAEFRAGVTAAVGPATSQSHRKVELALADGSRQEVTAKVVLVCDGLGHPSLGQLPEFRCSIVPGARIGVGAVVASPTGDELAPGKIHMVVGQHGYVGLVRTEANTVSLAAAVDRAALAKRTPHDVLAGILREAGAPFERLLGQATLRGTRPLTQQATRLADERLFVVGDAAGYIEPFTGEGMAIAIEAAAAVAPLALAAIDNWRPELACAWPGLAKQISTERQQVIRSLAWFLRRPKLLRPGLALAGRAPRVVCYVAERLNRSTTLPRTSA
jgi:menaquinone-9 beta-reductase